MKTVGIISDTHCRLPQAALDILQGDYSPDQVILHVAIDAEEDAGVLPAAPCDLIAHAGDVGYASEPCPWILDELEAIAPLVVVTGNCDWPDAYRFHGKPLPRYETFKADGVGFAMLHEPRDLQAATRGKDPLNPAYILPVPRVLVHGHTHVFNVVEAPAGSVTVCPGSVSRPRGGNPPTLAILKVEEPAKLLTIDIVALRHLAE